MPQGDGTGPQGKGPKSRKGSDKCNPQNINRGSQGQGGMGTGKGQGQGTDQGTGRGEGRRRGTRQGRGRQA